MTRRADVLAESKDMLADAPARRSGEHSKRLDEATGGRVNRNWNEDVARRRRGAGGSEFGQG